MKRSFRLKVVGVFLASIVLSMLLLTIMSTVLLKPIFISNSKKTMLAYADKIEVSLEKDTEQVEALLEEINYSYGITTHIIDKEGFIKYSYQKNQSNIQKPRYKRHIELYEKKDNKDGYYFKELVDETDNIKKIIFVSKVDSEAYILMNKAVKGIEQDTKIVSIFILIMGFTVAVVGTLVWSICTKNFTDAIKKMSGITRKMAELCFDEKVCYNGNDEIGVLASSVNTMSDELKTSIEGLKNDVERRKRLVRDISHELKTPITTIKGYLENIEFIAKDNELLQRYCSIASEECDEMDGLIEEMLEMSRLENDGYVCDMKVTDVSHILKIIEEKTQVEFIGHTFSIDFENGKILCNSVLITRAVFNFIKNAVKYGEKNKEISICGLCENGRYYFKVSNYGSEISEEEKESIWDPFYKNDKSRKRDSSHGIGLSMVKRIAHIHSGDVGCETKDGINTFYMWLNLNEEES